MAVTLKCAACGAAVAFKELSPQVVETCPGCQVRVSHREGDDQMAIPVSMDLPDEFQPVDLKSVADKSSILVGRYKKQNDQGPTASTEVVLAKALETLADSIGNLEERLNRQEANGQAAESAEAVPERETKTEPRPPSKAEIEVEVEETRIEPDEAKVEAVPAKKEEASTDKKLPRKRRKPAGRKRREETVTPVAKAAPSPSEDEVKVVEEEGAGEVVQLEPEEDPIRKARPVGARVLCRREAAREAHAFRREKHSQADWDDQADPEDQPAGFGWLMENYPKSTILVSLFLVGSVIAATILWMDHLFTTDTPVTHEPAPIGNSSMGALMAEDPEAGMAQMVALGYLNATSASSAAPFVYDHDTIKDKFEEYFRPIDNPGSYQLKLNGRVLTKDGTLFRYLVESGSSTRHLVVLPETHMPKVFWEFFEEVGDISWGKFTTDRLLGQALEMRVLMYPANHYVVPYDKGRWQSYILQDFDENRRVFAWAERGARGEWHVANALKTDPVTLKKTKNQTAVMALVRLRRLGRQGGQADGAHTAEIEEVIATSWLPERFRPKQKAAK